MNKSIFNTITIKVPTESIYKNPRNGSITLAPTLTKSNAITKRLGVPCIILKKDDNIIHPEIIENGKVGNYTKMKENYKKMNKDNTNINKNIKKFEHIDESIDEVDKQYNILKKKNKDLYELNDYLDSQKRKMQEENKQKELTKEKIPF